MADKTPMVWSDEDGDCYFGAGHIPPAEFKAACLEYDRENGWEDDEGAGEMDLSAVCYVWWFQPDPENDELMLRCEPDHPGALPFTSWYRWRNAPASPTPEGEREHG